MTPGEAPQPNMALLNDASHSYPTLAATSGDVVPFGAPVTFPMHSPNVAPSLSLPYGIGGSLPPIPSLDALLAGDICVNPLLSNVYNNCDAAVWVHYMTLCVVLGICR